MEYLDHAPFSENFIKLFKNFLHVRNFKNLDQIFLIKVFEVFCCLLCVMCFCGLVDFSMFDCWIENYYIYLLVLLGWMILDLGNCTEFQLP